MRDLLDALRHVTPQDLFAAIALALFWLGLVSFLDKVIA